MAQRRGKAIWRVGLREGKGAVELGSGLFKGPYSFARYDSGQLTDQRLILSSANSGR